MTLATTLQPPPSRIGIPSQLLGQQLYFLGLRHGDRV